ncbi:MAG TPA: DUF1566 domain-containing protein [Panacibacter sp.]|nr:DUF1566 domain-containing protein [Panacibacter sp.]
MKPTVNILLAVLPLLVISCTKESLLNQQAASTQTAINTTVQTTSHHYIGQRFGGGIVFYLADANGEHGIIADTVDLPPTTWWNGIFTVTGATAIAIGSGRSNCRAIILSQGKSGNYAALECNRSERSGYTDWHLPSKNELNELYKQKNVVGGFVNSQYWSSSELNYEFVWLQNFYNGLYSNYYKNAPSFNVRAVRGF